MIVEKIYQEKARKIKNYPCHSNRASSLGDPCLRRLVYERNDWDKKQLHDVGLQLVFDEGNNQEKIVLRDLAEAGFEIFEQQRSFEIRDLAITGHMDLKIKLPDSDRLFPCEIKSMSPHIFDKVTTLQDFFTLPYPWLKKYPGQLMLYMLESNEDRGVFILKNKSTGALKEIWVDFDWNLADELLKKAALINEHLSDGTYPDRVDDLDVCEKCPFAHICLPDKSFGPGFNAEEDENLVSMLDRLEELKPVYTEYEALNGKLKKALEEKTDIIIGNKYLVKGKWIEVKERFQAAYKYWKKSITKIA
jgi:CRISPR/Cas system-associated exonuclease Cas4 (RecB family)